MFCKFFNCGVNDMYIIDWTKEKLVKVCSNLNTFYY